MELFASQVQPIRNPESCTQPRNPGYHEYRYSHIDIHDLAQEDGGMPWESGIVEGVRYIYFSRGTRPLARANAKVQFAILIFGAIQGWTPVAMRGSCREH